MIKSPLRKYVAQSLLRFNKNTGSHQMSILKDDGVYRHLRFKNPDSVSYWFDIVTYPGNLIFNGDHGFFAFCRTNDMFEFFRDRAPNFEYWEEKLIASNGKIQVFDSETAKKSVTDAFSEYLAAIDDPELLDQYREEFQDVILNCCNDEYDFNNIGYMELDSGWVFDPLEHRDKVYSCCYLWACCAIPWAIRKYDKSRQHL